MKNFILFATIILASFCPQVVLCQNAELLKLTQQAELGDANAQFKLGYCYYSGQGVEKDYSQAVYWYKMAAGCSPQAQYELAKCYYFGQGVEKDYSLAIYWYKKAAEQGNRSAQYSLGNCYYYGEGVTKDYSQAVYWYKKAADQGNSAALFNMGLCYEYGNGIEQNWNMAKSYYEKAKKEGFTGAKEQLKGLPQRMWTSRGYSVNEIKGNGKTYFKISKSGVNGLISDTGREIIPVEMEDIEYAGANYFRFRINGYWGVMNIQGITIIPTSRGYTSIGNYISSQKLFPYTMYGYKGECDNTGKELSRIKTATTRQQSKTTSQKTTTTSNQQQQTPQRQLVPVQVWVQCVSCYGSGLCHLCHGGRGSLSDGSCLSCGYSGRCTFCAGRGGQYVVQYQ